MTASEKKWLNLFCVGLLAITTLPTLLGFWLQGVQWRFTGYFLGVGDGNSYIAKMLLGSVGEWLFRTPYTTFPQNGFLAFLPYMLLGKLVAPPGEHEQLAALFQIFRWAGGWLMVYGSYQFFSYFFEDVGKRRFCILLATLGGGVGWLALVGLQGLWAGRIPLEFYSPETFGFLSFFTLPHLAAARGLLLLGLVRYWQGYTKAAAPREAWFSGFLWLILGLMQPLTALIGWGLIGLDILVRMGRVWIFQQQAWPTPWKETLRYLAVMAICSLPVVIYSSVSFLFDPFLKAWTAQNIILSPPPGDYLMAYLFWAPICGVGAWWVIKKKLERLYPLLAWILVVPILAYFPVAIQRRLPEGSWTAFVALGVMGLSYFGRNAQKIIRMSLYTTLLTSLLLFIGSFLTVSQLQTPVYRPAEEVKAFEFIRGSAKSFPVVLASFDTSNAIPAWAPVRTLIGHGPESIRLAQIQPRVESFYQGKLNPQEEAQLLEEFHIRYVIWGPGERELGDRNPAEIAGLKLIFKNTSVQVFEVVE